MLKYLILAQICLTVGTPDWVVYLCYACMGLHFIPNFIVEWQKNNDKHFMKELHD